MPKSTVDARGLSCPQPVLLTLNKIRELGEGSIEVLVDNEASLENVSRAARRQGWEVPKTERIDEDYRLILERR